jgi:hypothetical protein
VRRISAAVAQMRFDRLYGAWAPLAMVDGVQATVLRSVDRDVAALAE